MITATEFRHVCCDWATRTENTSHPARACGAGIIDLGSCCAEKKGWGGDALCVTGPPSLWQLCNRACHTCLRLASPIDEFLRPGMNGS